MKGFGDGGHVVGFLHRLNLSWIRFFPFDLAKMGHQDDSCAFPREISNGRKSGLNTVVVTDNTVFLRDVKINANVDFLAL